MSTVNVANYTCFKLKPSQYRQVFQFFCGLIITILLYQALSLWLWLLCLITLGCSLFVFNRRPCVEQFEQLDKQIWSIKFYKNQDIEQVEIIKMVDHIFYIVVYYKTTLKQNKPKNLVLWQDQMSVKSWKMLKTRAKLG